jgi:DNA polymerase III sliding clamp (beta) subunit (PCNA family)
MKFSIDANRLLDALKSVISIATDSVVKDAPSAYRMTVKARAKDIVAIAHGGRLAMKKEVSDITMLGLEYKNTDEGSVNVDAEYFATALASFREDEVVNISLDGTELKMSLKGDKEQFQTVTTYPDPVELPKLADDFDDEITMPANKFLYGIDKVLFAIGDRADRPAYMHWVLMAEPNSVRFAAGTGGRFAILDLKGAGICKTESKASIMFPKEQSKLMRTIVGNANADEIIIKRAANPTQIVIEFKGQILFLVGIDPSITFPTLSKLLNANKSIQLTTNASDWLYATKGMNATYTTDYKNQARLHEARLHIDMTKKTMILKTKTPLRSSRKIPIVNIIKNDANLDKAELRCVGTYFSEILNYTDKDANINVFINGEDLTAPMCVKQLDKIDPGTGIQESFVTYFALLSEDDEG